MANDNNPPPSDAGALARLIAAGDAAAEADFAQRYTRPLGYFLLRRGLAPSVADDIVQETLVIVLERLRAGALRDPDRLGAYLHRTAVNLIAIRSRDAARQNGLLERYPLDVLLPPEAESLDVQLNRERLVADAQAAIESLRMERDREVLRGVYVEGRGKAELCATWNISEDHFDRVIARARKRLRAVLLERLGGAEDTKL